MFYFSGLMPFYFFGRSVIKLSGRSVSFAALVASVSSFGSERPHHLAYPSDSPAPVDQYPVPYSQKCVSEDPELVIIGAGPTGLMAGIEYLSLMENKRGKGFRPRVVLIEKRSSFNRNNIFNTNSEVAGVLGRHGLNPLSAGLLISHHLTHLPGNKDPEKEDVFENHEEQDFRPDTIGQLYQQSGVYSFMIGRLQKDLAREFLGRGGFIIPSDDFQILGDISKNETRVRIQGRELTPRLIVVADGSKSPTLRSLGFGHIDEASDPCRGERWIYGAVRIPRESPDSRGLVETLVIKEDQNMRVANVIIQPALGLANIAVLIHKEDERHGEGYANLISRYFNRTDYRKSLGTDPEVLYYTKAPVKVSVRRIPSARLTSNMVVTGDAAGVSSPLAGLGGTLALSAYPYALRQLYKSVFNLGSISREKAFEIFNASVQSFVDRWIDKSARVKNLIESL